MIEHDARANAHAAFFKIEFRDLAIVARKVDDQSFADRISNETCAGASGRHRKTSVSRCADDQACLLGTFRKRDANGLDLINRRVRRIQLSRQIIKARVATGLLNFPFLSGSHLVMLSEAKNLGLSRNNQRCFPPLNMTVTAR